MAFSITGRCRSRGRGDGLATWHCPRLVLVDILVFDGLDEMDAWGPAEVFRSAGKRGADIRTRLVTRLAQDTVLGAYGLRFIPDGVFEPGAADVLVVAGGGWAARDVAGAWGEAQRGDLLPLLVQARRSTPLVAGVCTGTMLLAHAGIVGSRRASTHRTAGDDLQALGVPPRQTRRNRLGAIPGAGRACPWPPPADVLLGTGNWQRPVGESRHP